MFLILRYKHSRMAKLLACLLAFFSFYTCPAQIPVNNPIDPADTELVEAVQFISRYFGEFTKGHLPNFADYWTAEDCGEYKRPDQLVYGINTEVATYRIGQPTILYAKPEHGYVHIKTLFGRGDSTGKVSVMSITNHYIERGGHNELHFVNPIRLADKDWKTATVGNVTYHYPAYHHFDKVKAQELIGRINALEHEWHVAPIPIRYYMADTKEELEHLRGFDFTVAMGNRSKPSGISDDVDNIVYCGGWGENYFHEVVHVYLNRLFPESPLKEGLAAFYGGSMGHELGWHIKRLNQYLQQHENINLDRLEDFYYMDNFTNPYSTIVGMLCSDAYSRRGIEGLRNIMSYTSLDELFATEYHVRKGEWNVFLRKMISDKS
jgi:hypothetical protein